MPELHELMEENEAHFSPETKENFASVVIVSNKKIVHLIYRSFTLPHGTSDLYRLRIWECDENVYTRTYYEFLEEGERLIQKHSDSIVVNFNSWNDIDTYKLAQLQQLIPNIHEIVQQALLTFLINNV